MILQALKEYYDRKAADPESGIAPIGWEWKEIPYVVVLSPEGKLVQLECTYEGSGKARRAKPFMVPHSVNKSINIVSNLLWANPEYALGIILKGKPARVPKQHDAFKKAIKSLSLGEDEGIRALLIFLNDNTKLEQLAVEGKTWDDLKKTGANVTFRLMGDIRIIARRPKVIEAVEKARRIEGGKKGRCLITGTMDVIAAKHSDVPINKDSKKFITFQKGSGYDSYGKEQGYNAPIGKDAESSYTEALKHLLRKDSIQRIVVGDSVTVFWASKNTKLEQDAPTFFQSKDSPDQHTRAVADFLCSVKNGTYAPADKDTRFYVLGLSPGSGTRIAVRFWHVGTVPEMAGRVAQYFQDLKINHKPGEPDHLPLWRLLASTATLGKSENVPPNLAGDMMRAILEGLPYPYALLQSAVRRFRIRPEPKKQDTIYPLAALLKASLNRLQRSNPNSEKSILPMLDLENQNIGYRLGRLFAALEKIQGEAQNSLNATIRDRFYGAASSTPVTVFGTLVRLNKHHLSKLERGRRVNRERLLGEIMEGISDFPAHLAIADQARFALGYYHQMQALFTKKAE